MGSGSHADKRVVVTGAGGHIGSEVIRSLLRSGDREVVPLVRRQAATGRFGPAVPVVADYDDEPALRRALTGADTLVMVSSDGPVAQVITHHANLIDAARHAGIAHIVALSGLDARAESPFCYAQGYAYTERLLREGYTEADLEKIWSGNVLRVLKAVEAVAEKTARTPEAK